MIAAWIALALIGVGLPLVAWWVGGRRVWSRSDERARRAQDEQRAWLARHGLSSADLAALHEAVGRGRALEEPRLRVAATELARQQLAVWPGGRDVTERTRTVLGALWIAVFVVLAVLSMVSGRWSWTLVLSLVNGAAAIVPMVIVRRNLRRALQLNSEGPEEA